MRPPARATPAASARPGARVTPSARALLLAGGSLAVAGVMVAVSLSERRDYHLPEYRPVATIDAALVRSVPAHRTVQLVGRLGSRTFRFKMAARFALLRHGVRPLSAGKDVRLGSWYDLDHRSYACTIYVDDGTRSPAPGAVAVAHASFDDGTGDYPVTAWMSHGGC